MTNGVVFLTIGANGCLNCSIVNFLMATIGTNRPFNTHQSNVRKAGNSSQSTTIIDYLVVVIRAPKKSFPANRCFER